VATVATAGVVGTLVVSTGAGPHSVLSPGVADAQSLVLLANHVATAPLKGDATLVFHGNSAKSEKPFTGADLYLDNGRYYYAMTPAGLPAAIKAGPQDYTLKPMIMAMSRVSSSDPQVARDAFLKAADPEWGGNIQHSPTATQDNVIWVSGIDVLGAGYGRPAVLAGMLRALATVHGVSVTHSHLNGAPTLEISMYVPRQTTDPKLVKRAIEQRIKAAGGHITRAERTALAKLAAQGRKLGRRTIPAHFMRATVDANTGALLRYTDIGLVVTYHVSRVDVAKFGGR
jgi:hypothetical protein